MHDLTFTLYENQTNNQGIPISASWEEWIEKFSHHWVKAADPTSKKSLNDAKNGPAIILGEIPLGKKRAKANIVKSYAIALDVENKSDASLENICRSLAPYEYFLWTTFKHGSQVVGKQARLRFVLPFETPVLPEAYDHIWRGLDALVGGINDPATKDSSRLHFLPATFDSEKAFTLHHPGAWLAATDLPAPTMGGFRTGEEPDIERLQAILGMVRKESNLKEAAQELAAGRPFAKDGERHKAILALTLHLALKNDHVPHTTLERLFRSSLSIMQDIDPTTPGIEDVYNAYDGAVRKLRERIPGGKEPYTQEDLERIAGLVGLPIGDLKNRWILQCEGSMFFLNADGNYVGPFKRDDLVMASTKYLSRAPVQLIEFTATSTRRIPLSEVACAHGTLANKIVTDMTEQKTRYEEDSQVIREAISPLRTNVLEPLFDPEIDKWLKVLGGDLYSKLVDWLSVVQDLTKILCAIYFDGVKDSGKTLFAFGVAKLWSEGPPGEIESVLGNFNDELARCPLVIADEELPKKMHSTVTATLRSMLSTTSRSLKRKYLPNSELRGAIRLIITANNAFVLDSKDAVSNADLDAIAQRFLYIHVSHDASRFLAAVPRDVKEGWARSGIARHALWLAANHTIKEPGGRFYISGDLSQMTRLLVTGAHWSSMVCEWLIRYLLQPEMFDKLHTGLIQKVRGGLFVNVQALLDGWNLYLNTRQDPDTARIGTALQAISAIERPRLVYGDKRLRYFEVDKQHLLAWAIRYSVGDEDKLKELLK